MRYAVGSRQNVNSGPSARSAAFTLVELLVVIAILSIVTVASIPFVIPALSSRAVREAARIVSTQFASARAQALATGRSVGVWMERLNGDPTGAIDLYLAEVPPAYAGQDVNETVTVTIAGATGTVTFSNAGFYKLLRPGDLIRFNNAGPSYVLSEAAGKNSDQDATDPNTLYLNQTDLGKTIRWLPTDNHFRCPPAAYAAGWTTTYQVFRQPIKLSSSAVSLPNGAVIDLIDSGVGSPPPGAGGSLVGNKLLYQSIPNNVWNVNPSAGTLAIYDDELKLFTTDPTDTSKPNLRAVVFTINSSGGLDSLCFNFTNPSALTSPPQTTAPVALSSPVYLMIGKREKVFQKNSSGNYDPTYYNTGDNAATQADKHNFRDLENLWIAINPQSGLATTTEVADIVDATYSGAGTPHDILAAAVTASRKFAQSGQSVGGR